MVERINTGIEGLDDEIEGGFPSESVNLVTGGPGAGKTTFCLNFLEEGLENEENCLYLTTDQSDEEIRLDALEYGIDFDKYIGNLSIAQLNPSKSLEKEVIEYIKEEEFDRVVLDSISVFEMYWGQDDNVRKYLNKLIQILKENSATTVITSEKPENQSGQMSRFGIAEFKVDGVIRLSGYALGESNFRSAQIVKMRRTDISGDVLEVEIDDSGISFSRGESL